MYIRHIEAATPVFNIKKMHNMEDIKILHIC